MTQMAFTFGSKTNNTINTLETSKITKSKVRVVCIKEIIQQYKEFLESLHV